MATTKLYRLFAALFLLHCHEAAPPSLRVEADSPAVAGDRLVEAIGLETLGGVFTPLLEVGCAIPCERTQVFSTAADDQTEISIALFRGTAQVAAENEPLGRFALVRLPAAPRGEPQIAVTLRADEGGISIRARDDSGDPVRVVRESR